MSTREKFMQVGMIFLSYMSCLQLSAAPFEFYVVNQTKDVDVCIALEEGYYCTGDIKQNSFLRIDPESTRLITISPSLNPSPIIGIVFYLTKDNRSIAFNNEPVRRDGSAGLMATCSGDTWTIFNTVQGYVGYKFKDA